MKTLMLYICATIVGFLLAFTMLFVLALMALPIILMYLLHCSWFLLAYIPFFAYYIHKQKTSFFDRMK